MEELIQIVLSNQPTLSHWKNDFKSEEWKAADNLHFKLHKTRLNQTKNCGCLDDFYTALNSKHKIKNIMSQENAKFLIQKDKLITLHQLGSKIVSRSSSQADHMLVLRVAPDQIVKFERFPSDWEKIVNGGKVEEVEELEVHYTEEVDPSQFKTEGLEPNPRKDELEAMTTNELKSIIAGMELEIPKGKKSDLVDFILNAEA